MADVIPFAPRRRSASQSPAALGPSGQILFFTGVRYERQPEPAASKPPRRPRPAGRGERETRRRRPG
ncbi:hypothetical protein B6S44_19710 [Bosea sp. Tri-44]|uniref:hypothetical protein n=1 Tax=Bosea sp. Tri-44 TaxID=1972137 RepID=UPI00100E90F3|nr:hypothetical protein [Bosea sp. Tri-44]RXT52967.1 hypothetical protein B6S44_19710 [Bosea sp. Tri-44]